MGIVPDISNIYTELTDAMQDYVSGKIGEFYG